MIAQGASLSGKLAGWMAGLIGMETTWLFHAVAMLIVATAVLLVIITPLGIGGVYIERKFAGRMQNRRGPNRVGPWGILQPASQHHDLFLEGFDRRFELSVIALGHSTCLLVRTSPDWPVVLILRV